MKLGSLPILSLTATLILSATISAAPTYIPNIDSKARDQLYERGISGSEKPDSRQLDKRGPVALLLKVAANVIPAVGNIGKRSEREELHAREELSERGILELESFDGREERMYLRNNVGDTMANIGKTMLNVAKVVLRRDPEKLAARVSSQERVEGLARSVDPGSTLD